MIATPGYSANDTDRDWSQQEIQRGATEIAQVIDRRLDYATTYRFARAVLVKSVANRSDTRGFRLGAELALTHWLARLPDETTWRSKAFARHRDVTHWIAQDSPLPVATVAMLVAQTLKLSAAQEGWLLSILNGEPSAPLRRSTPTAVETQ